MVFGFLFVGLVMGRYGPGVGLLAVYLAGVGGNLAAWLVYGESHRGLGASGMVMGALGLLTVQSVALLKQGGASAFRLFAGRLANPRLLRITRGVLKDPGRGLNGRRPKAAGSRGDPASRVPAPRSIPDKPFLKASVRLCAGENGKVRYASL